MISGTELVLWLAVETAERADAISTLVSSGDLVVVTDAAGSFGLVRSHDRIVTRIRDQRRAAPSARSSITGAGKTAHRSFGG